MMLGASTLDALQRIADRANDVLAAYRPGAFPLRSDVAAPRAPLPSTDPLSVVAPPGAWFVTAAADGTRTYTRAGTFHLGDDGVLRAPDGGAVLGSAGEDGGAPEPLRIATADRLLGRAAGLRVAADGTVAYARTAIDPRTRARTNEAVVVGRIALARFPAGSAPQRVDATRFSGVPGVLPHVGVPADGAFPPLTTAARDAGNVDLDASLQKLTEAYVAFSAMQAAHKAQGDGNKVVMDLLK
jgi:flagellar basal body rod protein FlgG